MDQLSAPPNYTSPASLPSEMTSVCVASPPANNNLTGGLGDQAVWDNRPPPPEHHCSGGYGQKPGGTRHFLFYYMAVTLSLGATT